MTQLILDTMGANITLPESQQGGYTCVETDLQEEVVMISGRMVKETRGTIWEITYQYGFFKTEEKNALIQCCRKGRKSPIQCTFLSPDSNEMQTGSFFVTEFGEPQFMWSTNLLTGAPEPVWAGFSITLREVKPHA
jgi:hypothetical protein